jgi:hypothetical protein
MKNANETAPQKMISTPTIVVLCIGGALIAYMLIQPLFAPKTELPAVSGSPAKVDRPAAKVQPDTVPSQPAAVAVANGAAPTPARPAASTGAELSSDRDPFVPSTAIARAAAAARIKAEPAAVGSVAPPQIKPVTVANLKPKLKPVAASPPAAGFAWQGVVGGPGVQQVVLIRHNARTYILHQGDPVPGTKYIVDEVTSETVLLASPSERLRLSKKKEAKVNG